MCCSLQVHVCKQETYQKTETKSMFNSQHMFAVKSKMVEFEVALKAIDEVRDHISKRDKATKDDIKAAFDELKIILQLRQELLLKQVGDLTEEKLHLIDEQKKRITDAHDRVSNYATFLDQATEKKETGELSAFRDVTTAYWCKQSDDHKVLQIEPCEQANIQFYCDDNFKSVIRSIGSVFASAVSPTHCMAEGSGISRATVGQLTDFATVLMTADNKPCNEQTQDVRAFLKQCSGETEFDARIVKREKNKIFFSYCPLEVGRHHLHIQVFGKEISKSPYTVNIQQPFKFQGDFVQEFSGIDQPWGVACTASGRAVVVDHTGWKGVVVFDSCGQVVDKFMDAMRVVNVWSPEGMCYYPTGITVDGEGNILVVDGGMNRIQKFTGNGTFLKVVGSAGNEILQFNSPVGIRVNDSGEVYVCDRKNHRIQVLDCNFSFLRTFGRCGPRDGELVFPRDVAFDSSQNAYIADTGNHRIQVFSPNGAFLRKFGCEGEGRGQFKHLSSICIDMTDHVYVADKMKHCITVFTTGGEVLRVVGGAPGSAPGVLNEPHGIDVSRDGLLYVADTFNKRIQVFR